MAIPAIMYYHSYNFEQTLLNGNTISEYMLNIKTELQRRRVARWAMIARKMKREENLSITKKEEFGWMLSILYRLPDRVLEKHGSIMISPLTQLLSSKVGREAELAARVFERIMDPGVARYNNGDTIKACITSGAISRLGKMLYTGNHAEIVAALYVLRRVANGDDECRGSLIELKVINGLIDLLYKAKYLKHITEASELLSLISEKGNHECIRACKKRGVMPALLYARQVLKRNYELNKKNPSVSMLTMSDILSNIRISLSDLQTVENMIIEFTYSRHEISTRAKNPEEAIRFNPNYRHVFSSW